ncbi:hypothetical protein B0H15DRAFT_917558, partial [Mycena belliarum]
MAPNKKSKGGKKGPPLKRKCTCGCGKEVSAQTERNHNQGRTTPLVVRAFHAARRLGSILGLSPDRRRTLLSKTKLLSPHRSPRKRHAGKNSGATAAAPMNVGENDESDMLPHFTADSPQALDRDVEMEEAPLASPQTRAPPELYNPGDAENFNGARSMAREGVWSNGHRVTIEDEEEEDLDADLEAEDEDEGGEGEDGFWADEDEYYDEYEELYGLPAEDLIDEDLERELAQFAEELSENDLAILRAFALKTEDHLTNATFEKLAYAFPGANIQTLKATKARIEFLAEFKPVAYDCCPGSCCCYVGPHADETQCPYCNEPRFKADGRARKTFTYIPLIPRLVAYFKNAAVVEQMSYRGKYEKEANMNDVFDGTNYHRLRERFVTVNGQRMPYKFFSGLRDIALGLSTDGFAPFKRRKKTC